MTKTERKPKFHSRNVNVITTTKAYLLIAYFLLAVWFAALASDISVQDYADALFQKWTAPETGWTVSDVASVDLAARRQEYLELPESVRSEVMDRVFDKAASTSP